MNLFSHVISARSAKSKAMDSELAAEFDFHVACRTDELIRSGMSPELARANAERAFGDRRRIASECRRLQRNFLTPWGWFAIVCSALIIGWLTYTLIGLQMRNATLAAELQSAMELVQSSRMNVSTRTPIASLGIEASLPANDGQTFKGKVTDVQGNPISGAKVILIHKDWPDGKFQQANHCVTTGEDGTYAFEGLYQKEFQNAFLVSVLAEGYEMRSRYELYKPGRAAPAFDLQLKPAKSIKFLFVDESGAPLAETDLFIASRKVGTKEHLIYEMSAQDAKSTTDDKGSISISHLLPKDQVSFGILIFDEVQTVEYKVSDAAEQTVKLQKKR